MMSSESESDSTQRNAARHTPRIAAITFGVTIQFVTGALVFALPPGGSVMTWLIYVALGVVGLVHILMGAMLGREAPQERDPITRFEADDIPWHAKVCPRCGESVADALHRGKRRCPSCDAHFTSRDLGWRMIDLAGEPISLSPYEKRLSGRNMLLVLAILIVVLIATAIYAGIAWPAQPGP